MITHQLSNSYGNYNYNAFVYTDISWTSHFHGNYELIYAIESNTRITVNGTVYLLTPGDFLLIAPYSVHSMAIKGASKVWIGVFSEDYVTEFSRSQKGARFSVFRCDEKIEEFLKEYLLFEGRPERYICIACLNAVCSECVRNGEKQNAESDTRFAEAVIEFISSNIQENISMSQVADALGYEYHYFSYLFNKYFSLKFKSFINQFRFQHACSLLADNRKSISDVCFECGFETVRNFNRIFKELSGTTPSVYRKNI